MRGFVLSDDSFADFLCGRRKDKIMEENEKKEEMNKQTDNAANSQSMNQTYGFAPDAKLKECKHCRVMIPKKAKICPNCKMRVKMGWLKKLLLILFLLVIIGAAVCGAGYYLYLYQNSSATSVTSTEVISGDNTGVDNRVKETVAEPAVESAADSDSTDATEAQDTQSKEEQTAETQTDAVKAEEPALQNETVVDKQSESDETVMPEGLLTPEQDDEQPVISLLEPVGNEKNQPVTGKTDKSDQGKKSGKEDNTEAEKETIEDKDAAEQQEDEESFKESCEQIDYKTMLRQMEEYLDKPTTIEVTVVAQIDGGLFDDNIYYLCVSKDKKGIERYYIIRDDREEKTMMILEGDVLCIYGTLFDQCRLPASVIVTRPTVPAISMKFCELLDE